MKKRGGGDGGTRWVSREPLHKTLWDMLVVWGFILKAMGHHSWIIIKRGLNVAVLFFVEHVSMGNGLERGK